MSCWPWRVIIVVPNGSRALAENAARAINSTGPGYTGNAFNIPLSESGAGNATHLALYTSATDEMVSAMASALPQITGVMYWRHGVDGDLQASNVTEATGQAWGFTESLNAAGLRVVTQLMP